ncbi:hypothetical protein FJY84_08865, partial [Candidatus Bathyarchaeota archaeon]|nr:hypothetical protein [Candidatus Bathyarchaeota archaeon]
MFKKPNIIQRNSTWILLSLILIITVLWALYVFLDFNVNQSMYLKKAGLNWFQTVFYNNYLFISAAILALLTLNPVIGKSELFEIYNSVQQYIKITTATAGIPTSFSMPSLVIKRKTLAWVSWQFIKWLFAFTIIISTMEIPFIGPFMNVVYMMISGIGNWSYVPRIFLLAIQPASSTELISLMPTIEVQYRFLFIIMLSIFGVISFRLILKSIKEFINAKYSTGMRNIFIILSLTALSFIFDAPYWRMDITTPHYYYIALTLLLSFTVISIILHRGLTPLQFTKIRKQNIFVTGTIFVLIGIIVINAGIIALYNFNWNNNWA